MRRLVTLDSLRGGLALYVVCYHFLATFPILRESVDSHTLLFSHGSFAVDCFFVLSGFVMMYVYGNRFGQGLSKADLFEFFVARFARLYPVQIATFGLLLSWFFVTKGRHGEWESFLNSDGRYSWEAAVANLVFLQGPCIDHRTWNYPSWSLSAEWHAYVLFPLLVPVVRRLNNLVVAVAVASAVPVGLYCWYQIEDIGTNGLISLLRVIPLFVIGMVAYRLRDQEWTGSTSIVLLGTVGTLALLIIPRAWILLPIAAPTLLFAALNENWFSRLLHARILVWLGEQSYSLYMIHALIQIFTTSILLPKLGFDSASISPMVGLWWVALMIVVSLLVADQVRRWIEVPAREAIKQRARDKFVEAII